MTRISPHIGNETNTQRRHNIGKDSDIAEFVVIRYRYFYSEYLTYRCVETSNFGCVDVFVAATSQCTIIPTDAGVPASNSISDGAGDVF